jgi:hypothetical protein
MQFTGYVSKRNAPAILRKALHLFPVATEVTKKLNVLVSPQPLMWVGLYIWGEKVVMDDLLFVHMVGEGSNG